MEQRREELVRRPLYGQFLLHVAVHNLLILMTVYDLPQDILSTLKPKEDTGSSEVEPANSFETPEREQKDTSTAGAKACSSCGISFHTVEEQRSHVRSDYHVYNQKQRLKGLKTVTEAEFETLVGGEQVSDASKKDILIEIRSRRKSFGLGF